MTQLFLILSCSSFNTTRNEHSTYTNSQKLRTAQLCLECVSNLDELEKSTLERTWGRRVPPVLRVGGGGGTSPPRPPHCAATAYIGNHANFLCFDLYKIWCMFDQPALYRRMVLINNKNLKLQSATIATWALSKLIS